MKEFFIVLEQHKETAICLAVFIMICLSINKKDK